MVEKDVVDLNAHSFILFLNLTSINYLAFIKLRIDFKSRYANNCLLLY